MWSLHVRMYLLLAALFGIIYMVITVIGFAMGIGNFYVYLVVAGVLMYIQYALGPKLVEWSMKVKYVEKEQYPHLHYMVESLARKAGIPKPKIGVAQMSLPNAFAFGKSLADGRICVTEGILRLLNGDELRAVLGHEMSHLKNRDVLTITILSVIPMVLYYIAFHFLWFGGSRRSRGQGNTVLIGLAALLFYFVTNLLVLYASRIREYFADRGSLSLGNRPESLASALYKLVYGSARMEKEALKNVEGLKAFFVNDPSRAMNEIKDLAEVDLDRSGTIDPEELRVLRNKKIEVRFSDRLMEALSTHPNMLKRIKQLSEYKR